LLSILFSLLYIPLLVGWPAAAVCSQKQLYSPLAAKTQTHREKEEEEEKIV
jgi:hypothetical protein